LAQSSITASAAAANQGPFNTLLLGNGTTVFKLPGMFVGGGIILNVIVAGAALKHQYLQTFLGKLFGGPSATNAAAYHNGVVSMLDSRFAVDVERIIWHASVLFLKVEIRG
jgi:hypothetical protein